MSISMMSKVARQRSLVQHLLGASTVRANPESIPKVARPRPFESTRTDDESRFDDHAPPTDDDQISKSSFYNK